VPCATIVGDRPPPLPTPDPDDDRGGRPYHGEGARRAGPLSQGVTSTRGDLPMRQLSWTSKSFYLSGLVMILASFGLIAVATVATSSNPHVEARLAYLTAILQATGVMITGGL